MSPCFFEQISFEDFYRVNQCSMVAKARFSNKPKCSQWCFITNGGRNSKFITPGLSLNICFCQDAEYKVQVGERKKRAITEQNTLANIEQPCDL